MVVVGCSHPAKPAQAPAPVAAPVQQACDPDIIAETYKLDEHNQSVPSTKFIDEGAPGPGTLTVREAGKPPFVIDVAANGKLTLKPEGGEPRTAWVRDDGVFFMHGDPLFFGELHADHSVVLFDIPNGVNRKGTVDAELAVDTLRLGIDGGRVTGLPEDFQIDVKGCVPTRKTLFIAAIALVDKFFIIDQTRGL